MTPKRPKILFLSDCSPYGKAFGGQLRALHTARALGTFGEVSFVVVSSDSPDELKPERSSDEFDIMPPVLVQPSPNRGLFEKLRWALDPRFLNVHGCSASHSDRLQILSSFSAYDLVWVLNSRTPNVLQIRDWPHSHLDLSDIPSTYLGTVARNGANPIDRWRARAQQILFKRREVLFRKRFTTLSVCSEADRHYLGGGDRIHVVPNGFQLPSTIPVPKPSTSPHRIGFIGLYSYTPNREGVEWFLRECWPAIRRAVPGVRFRLIGKGTDGSDGPKDAGVEALGFVQDPASEIATWSTIVIPIRLGGGTRVKIAEAFSRKCPAVSTSLGAFGYEVTHGRQLLLADEPEDFSRACIELIRNPARGSEIADRAWGEFLEKWTWDAIAPKVWAAAEDCLQRSKL